MQSYKDLIVWNKSIELVSAIYEIVDKLPKHELYILASQMLRAAISIPSNIAEGSRRNHKAEYIQFLSVAISSAAELETQLVIVQNRYKLPQVKNALGTIEEIQKMLYVIIKKLKSQ